MPHKRVTNWTANTDADTVNRRAGGRRRHNLLRALRAEDRRTQVIKLLDIKGGMRVRGTQAAIARELGVSRMTICRDIWLLIRRVFPIPDRPDPMAHLRERLAELWRDEAAAAHDRDGRAASSLDCPLECPEESAPQVVQEVSGGGDEFEPV